MTGAVHVVRTDRSSETGSLVYCTCGMVLGPFQNHVTAAREATTHRRIHETEHKNAQQRERRAAGN